MKRYYLCDIIGDGSQENAYRPALADEAVNWTAVMPASDPNTGAPVSPWALVVVETNNHARLLSKAGVDPLPDFPLDGKVTAIENATRTAVKARLSARGIPTALVDNADGYREVIRGIGRRLEAAFDENNFDIADPNAARV